MDTGAARARVLVVGGAAALGLATALLAFSSDPAPAPASPAGGASLTEPRDAGDVHGFVTACALAGEDDEHRLRQLARSDSALVAGRAIAALGRLGRVADDPRLLRHLDDHRPRVRHETIVAIGGSGHRRFAPLLIPILDDPDPQARLLAVHALGQLGAEDTLAELAEAPGTDAATRAFARATLQQFTVPQLLSTTAGLR